MQLPPVRCTAVLTRPARRPQFCSDRRAVTTTTAAAAVTDTPRHHAPPGWLTLLCQHDIFKEEHWTLLKHDTDMNVKMKIRLFLSVLLIGAATGKSSSYLRFIYKSFYEKIIIGTESCIYIYSVDS